MGQIINVPGEGPVEFPDSMSDEQIRAVLARKLSKKKGPDMGAAIAAAGDAGPDVMLNKRGQVLDQEGNVVGPPVTQAVDSEGVARFSSPDSYQPSGPQSGGQNRPFKPRAEDMLTRAADSLSFGLLPKASAKIGELQGKGTYDELLAKRRQEVEEAGARLGPAGAILADVGGGVLTGSALGRLPALWKSAAPGATILGHVPKTAGLLTKTAAGAAEGAGYGAASAAGHTDDPDKLLGNTLEGAGVGGATGGLLTGASAVIPRLITPFPTTDPVRREAMETLRKAGVDVTAGTKTGDPKLRLAEDIIGKLPLGGKLTNEQMPQVTSAVMQKAGIEGNPAAATTGVVKGGFQKVGQAINDLQAPHTLTVDDPVLNLAAKVESDIKPLVADGFQKPLQHFIDKLTSKSVLKPDEAQALRTQLTEAIGDATDSSHRRGLMTLKEGLDDLLERTMTVGGKEADIAALKLARNQYAHLNILIDALKFSGDAGKRGELTPSALARAVEHSVGRREFYSGAGDLNKLASASAGYLQPPRDSFTATREGYLNPLKWAMGAAGRAGLGNPAMQKYWGNQFMPTAPVSGAAVQPAVAGAAGPADRIREGLLSP